MQSLLINFQILLAILFLLFVSIRAQHNLNRCPDGTMQVTTGKNCPCVSVDSTCTIIDSSPEYAGLQGKNCSKLTVKADSYGNYPDVMVQYSWKMCNKNHFDILLNRKGKFFDWTRAKGSKNQSLANPRFPLKGTVLASDTCLTREETLTINTGSRYNIATQLEGFVLDPDGKRKDPRTDYCYAYTSDAINIKRGLCNMSTEAACKVNGTQTSCQDYIDETAKRDLCVQFDASLTWKVCNNENYDMRIFSDSSEVKVGRNVRGRSRINVIAKVQDLSARGCERFNAEVRNINSCSRDKFFFSANVQGSNPNGKYWNECQDYSFHSLQFSAVCPEFSAEGLNSDVEKINSGRVTPIDGNCVQKVDGSISLAYMIDGNNFPGVKYSGAAIFSSEKVLLVDDQIIRVAPSEWEACTSLIGKACGKILKTKDPQ